MFNFRPVFLPALYIFVYQHKGLASLNHIRYHLSDSKLTETASAAAYVPSQCHDTDYKISIIRCITPFITYYHRNPFIYLAAGCATHRYILHKNSRYALHILSLIHISEPTRPY